MTPSPRARRRIVAGNEQRSQPHQRASAASHAVKRVQPRAVQRAQLRNVLCESTTARTRTAATTVAFLELLLAVAAMGGWISKQVRYAPHTARRWAANLNGLSPEEAYAPLRRKPELFESLLRDEWLAPTLLDVVQAARRGQCHRDLREEAPGVFSFAMFSDAFCRDFLREVDGYMDSGLPIRRPNSMNNYGLIVNEIGMLDVISELQREVLWPIAQSLWPKEGSAFHAHHSFMVQYRKSEDPGLDMHTDDSDVTFNVCLGEVFAGAGLTFCGGVGNPDHRQRAPASVDVPRKLVAA